MPVISGGALILSTNDRFLQAHKDNGEMHASNQSWSSEELWGIELLGAGAQIALIGNDASGRYISKRADGCVYAVGVGDTPDCHWRFIDGAAFGTPGKYAIQSTFDGTFMGANPPGQNVDRCGGEVASQSNVGPPHNYSDWEGWWRVDQSFKVSQERPAFSEEMEARRRQRSKPGILGSLRALINAIRRWQVKRGARSTTASSE